MKDDLKRVDPSVLRKSWTVPPDLEVVGEYALMPSETMPPIEIVTDLDGAQYVVDGHHSLEAALARGDVTVPISSFTQDTELNAREVGKRKARWFGKK